MTKATAMARTAALTKRVITISALSVVPDRMLSRIPVALRVLICTLVVH
ncbi:hypothetical protein LCM08_16830 [Salipiger pacificus]|nr:hypothetical protein [Alloyangia mangrovi]MCA0941360.1 hypothetical protein [Alloyangia pacifica]MCA0946590.1 hypothetical protein [Alloyangia pacifica]